MSIHHLTLPARVIGELLDSAIDEGHSTMAVLREEQLMPGATANCEAED